jgi:hypothetical protein
VPSGAAGVRLDTDRGAHPRERRIEVLGEQRGAVTLEAADRVQRLDLDENLAADSQECPSETARASSGNAADCVDRVPDPGE